MDTSRRMLYPYTFTAKIMQFPFKYYYHNNPAFKSYAIAIVLVAPFMYKIQKATFSPAIVEKREKRLKLEHEEYLEHQKHLF